MQTPQKSQHRHCLQHLSGLFIEFQRDKIQACIQGISVKGSTCFDLADRAFIENKISLEYKSFAHFERFSKFTAIEMWTEGAIFPAVECYSSWLREKDWSNVPDNPAETQCLQRSSYVEEVFAREWFEMELTPMIAAERKAPITGR